MADIKWIKIVTDIFDDEKMLLIESLPSADSIIVVWFKLLCLAGKTNNSGVFIFNDRIPYTDEMLASIFRRDVNIVRLALDTFEKFGMVEIVDSVITIPNWSKHQSLDAYEKRKERDRLYQQTKRQEQKRLALLASTEKSSDASADKSADVGSLEEDKEEDKDKEKEEDREEEPTADEPPAPSARLDYESIKSMYNEICKSFPRCTSLSDARKKAIKARFASGHTVEDFKALFTKAEASSFLKGSNNRNWQASFDWLIKDANMAKVLDGNYDDMKGANNNGQTSSDSGQVQRVGKYI